MDTPVVLVIGGSDPTGGAGIQMDTKALALTGVHACTAVTCVTTQTTSGFHTLRPIPAEDVMEQLDRLMEDMSFNIVKMGLLPCPDMMKELGQKLRTPGLKTIVDPVLSFTVGGSMPAEIVESYKHHILPLSWLATPNLEEARVLTGRKDCGRPLAEALGNIGPRNVLITGGHGDPRAVEVLLSEEGVWRKYKSPRIEQEFHGTGCAFSSMISGRLASGDSLEDAVARSKRMLHNRMKIGFMPGKGVALIDLVSREEDVVFSVARAARHFCSIAPPELVPEVGSNISFALPHAITHDEIAGVEGRIVRGPDGPLQVGCAALGAARHTARIVLAAMEYDPSKRCALNIRYSRETLQKLEDAGFSNASFQRGEEPEHVKSMEWGTCQAIESCGRVPDIVWDSGGMGKEPMIRIIGRNPDSVVAIVEKISGY